MQIVPQAKTTRFEQLEPGELFVFLRIKVPCLALKTAKSPNSDKNEAVLLGPTFPYDLKEAVILPWDTTTVVSYGQNWTVRLPIDPAAWFEDGDTRAPVCLALAGDEVFVCANGADNQFRFFQCFVNLRTGEILENQLPNIGAFTRTWEIVVNMGGPEPQSLINYPFA